MHGSEVVGFIKQREGKKPFDVIVVELASVAELLKRLFVLSIILVIVITQKFPGVSLGVL